MRFPTAGEGANDQGTISEDNTASGDVMSMLGPLESVKQLIIPVRRTLGREKTPGECEHQRSARIVFIHREVVTNPLGQVLLPELG